jgi:disulfide bond formation protein DsbB
MYQTHALARFSTDPRYWLSLILLSIILLSTALFFQYGLHEPPCIMCIHMRLWVMLLFIVGVFGILTTDKPVANFVSQTAVLGITIGMAERAYMLLGTERGFVFSDCGFSLGLPEWLALEEWFPALFRIETSCGYTPEILFGITMAESLMVLSVILVLTSGAVLLSGIWARLRD